MPNTNAPRNIATDAGNISLETEIIDSQRRARQIPIVEVRVTILPGNVKSPNILFKHALREGYAAATSYLNIQPKPNSDTVRIIIKHDDLIAHNHMWSSSTHVIGQSNALNEILDEWENAMQSGEEIDLSSGSIEFICQYVLTREQQPRNTRRVGAQHHTRTYAARKEKMYNRVTLQDIFNKDHTLLEIPNTLEKVCFPMAFLSSQCRFLDKDANGKIINVVESGAEHQASFLKTKHTNIFIPCPIELKEQLQRHLPYFYFENHICLFNCFRIAFDKYSALQLQLYIQLAQYIHHYVEMKLQRSVDMNDLEDVCTSYSQAFEVIIHIRRMELQGQRIQYYFHEPNNQPERHITIMLNNYNEEYDHCYSMLHIRNWSKSNQCASGVNPSGYCDYCNRIKADSDEPKAKSIFHLNECQSLFYNHELSNIKIKNTRYRQRQFRYDTQRKNFQCQLCYETIDHHSQLNTHQCYTPVAEIKLPIDENKIFVFDVEATQKQLADDEALYIHNCNLVCIRSVYNNTYRQSFRTITDFMEELLTNTIFRGGVILAHNGGAYDCKFILQYLEHHLIPYSVLPRPGSQHKYLTLTIHGKTKQEEITFKDFMMFVSGSLKSIAEGFKLPISKGDFPHKFNIPEHQQYIGSLPLLESDDDYFCLQQKKSKKEIDEIKEWYHQQSQIYCTCYQQPCTCFKQPWNLQQQLLEYCWLDVDVLSEIVKKFRDTHLQFGQIASDTNTWTPTSIDPFNYSTQSQVAMNFFLAGKQQGTTAAISTIKHRNNFSKISISWLEYMSRTLGIFIQHIGNSEKEYYCSKTKRYLDGFSGNKVFQFHGCYYHGCPKCFPPEAIHPQKKVPFGLIYDQTIQNSNQLKDAYKEQNVFEMWECDWKQQYELTQYDQDLSNIILDREELFYGGRTEVFSPYANDNAINSIQYHDVCSLYPTVCTHDVLPIGFPTRYFGLEARAQMERLHPNHSNSIFGYVRCHVRPNVHDRIGLLPEHKNNKLIFDLTEKKGTWFTEELYLAMSQGYQVLDVYEILDFDQHNRSNDYMKGYMSFFLRMKQESEGWKKANASSENPSDDEKETCIQELFELNGNVARMRADYVQKNDVQRQIAKIYLNCLWGKYAQSSINSINTNIYGYSQFSKIHFDSTINHKTLRYRHIQGEAYQVTYEYTKDNYRFNRNYNIWIAAAVTAHARCRLHRQMLKIGPQRILYCDTDSIIFLCSRLVNNLASRGLGNWVDETIDFGSAIKKLYAFAPKSYCLVLENGEYRIKAKGCRMTIPNKEKANPQVLEKILISKCIETAQGYIPQPPLLLDHFTIFSNCLNLAFPYGTLFSRYSTKKFDVVISKRLLIPLLTSDDILANQTEYVNELQLTSIGRIETVPFGFDI